MESLFLVCLSFLSLSLYIFVCLLFDLFVHIHNTNGKKIASLLLIHETKRKRAKDRERDIENDTMKENNELEHVLGKEKKLLYCTISNNNKIV